MSTPSPLFGNYSFQEVSEAEFSPFFNANRAIVFPENSGLFYQQFLSESEREKQIELAKHFKNRQFFYFFIYYKSEIVGWHFGKQMDGEEYYMINTGIFKAHQNKGVYQTFLREVLAFILDKGYQIISSKHHASNNAVLVPKLKAGFVIQSIEIDLAFGTMIKLIYLANEKARSIYNYRTGSHTLPEH